jgi:hypothetical protein
LRKANAGAECQEEKVHGVEKIFHVNKETAKKQMMSAWKVIWAITASLAWHQPYIRFACIASIGICRSSITTNNFVEIDLN